MQQAVSKVCRVCGDDIGFKENGELFVACHVCGFPVCRPCYDYERSEGTQCCPQCNTRYKRHKGCPRVAGDDEDYYADDFDEEFQIVKNHNDHDSSEEKNHAIDIQSENGDHSQQKWQTNNQPFSVQGSVKDFEGNKEVLGSAEWKDRVEKWKVKQENRGLVNKDDGNDDDQGLV